VWKCTLIKRKEMNTNKYSNYISSNEETTQTRMNEIFDEFERNRSETGQMERKMRLEILQEKVDGLSSVQRAEEILINRIKQERQCTIVVDSVL
jgi:hypothetical protein